MTIHLDYKSSKTLCGGKVNIFVSQNDSTTKLKFEKVQEVVQCEECEFRAFCPILDRAEPIKAELRSIKVVAFTGMPIGTLNIVRESKLFIEVETKGGQLIRFDRKSGVQTNCVNSRYANRVDPKEIPVLQSQSKSGEAQ